MPNVRGDLRPAAAGVGAAEGRITSIFLCTAAAAAVPAVDTAAPLAVVVAAAVLLVLGFSRRASVVVGFTEDLGLTGRVLGGDSSS